MNLNLIVTGVDMGKERLYQSKPVRYVALIARRRGGAFRNHTHLALKSGKERKAKKSRFKHIP